MIVLYPLTTITPPSYTTASPSSSGTKPAVSIALGTLSGIFSTVIILIVLWYFYGKSRRQAWDANASTSAGSSGGGRGLGVPYIQLDGGQWLENPLYTYEAFTPPPSYADVQPGPAPNHYQPGHILPSKYAIVGRRHEDISFRSSDSNRRSLATPTKFSIPPVRAHNQYQPGYTPPSKYATDGRRHKGISFSSSADRNRSLPPLPTSRVPSPSARGQYQPGYTPPSKYAMANDRQREDISFRFSDRELAGIAAKRVAV